MTFENVILEKRDGIATITLNRPQALNALDTKTMVELRAALEDAEGDDGVGVVILRGTGRAFSSGHDLKELGSRSQEEREAAAVLERGALETIDNLSKPVIAALHGYVVTGGMEVAMTCDIVVAAEDTLLGDTHARWGFTPGWGGSQRLPRLVGPLKAKELFFTTDLITAREAERIGLVNKVVPGDKLEEETRALAEKILKNSRGSVKAIKWLVNQGMKLDMAQALRMEWENPIVIEDSPERVKGFVERKKA